MANFTEQCYLMLGHVGRSIILIGEREREMERGNGRGGRGREWR
jgi:hypothetical protein